MSSKLCFFGGKTAHLAIAASFAINFLAVSYAVAQTSDGKKIPHMIECEVKGIRYFVYLERITAEGEILYITPDRRGAVKVVNGVLERAGEGVASSCKGKTLDEMISDGKGFFMENQSR